MIPVKGYSELYRDENSNAILNDNDSEYNEYIKTKSTMLDQKHEIKVIKNDIEEIKRILQTLVSLKS